VDTKKLYKAEEKINQKLPKGVVAEVFPSAIDGMLVQPNHILIRRRGWFGFGRTIARLIPDDDSGHLEIIFEDPVEAISKIVSEIEL